MASERHAFALPAPVPRSWQSVKHLIEQAAADRLAPLTPDSLAVLADSGTVVGRYVPLHPHVQE